MKNIVWTALVGFGLAVATPAGAQAFGQFMGAEPLAPNARLFGGYIHSSQNESGLLGQLRLSFYPEVDFGFQGGLVRRDLGIGDRTTLRLGGDFKVRVAKPTDQRPVSIAIGGVLGVETGDEVNILTLGPTVTGSRAFTNGHVTPYARAGIAFTKLSIASFDDTDISVPIRLGADFRLNAALGLVFEIQANLGDRLNDDLGIAGGVNLPF